MKARRPFAKDPELTYDFDIDSEDEWEDEAEGENLSVSRYATFTESAVRR